MERPPPPAQPPFGWYAAIGRRPLARNLRAVAFGLRSLFWATPLGEALLGVGRTPATLTALPVDPWPGNADRGRAIALGRFSFAGRSLRMRPAEDADLPFAAGAALWDARDGGEDWLTELHGFAWLSDLRVVGGDPARRCARGLIADWIAGQGRWKRRSWRPDILARRLVSWIAAADIILQGAPPDFALAFHRSLARQARHLSRAGAGGLAGARRLTVLKGRVYAAVALWGGRGLPRTLQRLDEELARQIQRDGGHIERSPAQQFIVLRDLVDIRTTLSEAGHAVPHGLQNAIDRMAPMLRFYRHGDGGLALFNDSGEGEAWLIDMVLSRAEAPGKPLTSAPHTGFDRLAANRTLVICDVGPPPPPGARDHVFAGTLSFEMSIGKERLIVNCGGGPGLAASWRQGLRATAAHSTLTLADTNSTEIFEAPGRGSEIGKHPRAVTRRRAERDGAIWLEGRHDGYLRGFGLTHERRLWLSPGGDELRGEETLLPGGVESLARLNGREDETPATPRWPWRRGRPRVFHLRFHLHPKVSATPVQEGGSVLLRLASGAGWRFHAEGGSVSVEDSVYVGAGGLRRCQQIVVSGGVQASGPRSGAVVRWALTRVADR